MKLMGLSFKNATVKWWRTLTLGFFIFSVSFVMVISSSFVTAVKRKVENVVINGITGHIQIRSEGSMEGDMAVQYSQGWDALEPMGSSAIKGIMQVLDAGFPEISPALLVRQNAFINMEGKREETMLIGIEPGFDSYTEAFMLTQGRYLDPSRSDEILLTEEQAAAFKVGVGDTVTVSSKNVYGLNSSVDLKVAGIGNFVMLSLFSYKAGYASGAAVRNLMDMEEGEATDVILFLPDKEKWAAYAQKLSAELKSNGIKYVFTSDEKLKSEDLKITDLTFEDEDDKENGVKISSFDEMGKTFKGVSDTMFAMLNILILFLLVIVSILIINLVYMTGLERYREIGTLRAIGFSRLQVIRIFMAEVLSVAVLSGFLGILAGIGTILLLGFTGISSPAAFLDFIMGRTLNLEIDFKSIAYNMAVITGFSFAASFYPAYKACSIDPSQALRTV